MRQSYKQRKLKTAMLGMLFLLLYSFAAWGQDQQITFTWIGRSARSINVCVTSGKDNIEVDWGNSSIMTYSGKGTIPAIDNVTISPPSSSLLACDVTITALSGADIGYFSFYYNTSASALDVSKAPKLISLYCHSNQLQSLDVSANTVLQRLHCYGNQLQSLNLSANTALAELQCYGNKISLAGLKDIADNTGNIAQTSKHLGTQTLDILNWFTNTAVIDNVFGGTSGGTNFAVTLDGNSAADGTDYSISGGTITFKKLGLYVIEITNPTKLISSTSHPAKVIARYRVKSTDASLSGLTASGITLSPSFASGTYSYSATVANAVASVTLDATTTHGKAVITSGHLGNKPLAVGDNTFTITVTAEGGNTQDYTINIYRKSADASLSALSAAPATLTPALTAGTYVYNTTVANTVTSVTLAATTEHANAAITTGHLGSKPLAVGDNQFTITVTAEDDSFTQDYTVNLIRRGNPIATDFDFDLTPETYENIAQPVSVSEKLGIEGMGNITVLYNGSTDAPVNAGTYAVTIDVTEGAKYHAASGIPLGGFTINPAPLTVTADEGQNKVFGTSDPIFAYQLTSGQLFGTHSFTGSLSRASGNNVGTYAITEGSLSVADGNNGNNYAIDFQSNLFVIIAASGDITIDPVAEKTYGDADFALSASHTGGVPVKFESSTPDIAEVYLSQRVYTVRIKQAGSAIIRAYTEAGNYEAAENFLIVTINKAAAVVPASLPEGLEATYGDRFRDVSPAFPEGFRWPSPSSKVGDASSSPVKVTALYNPGRNKYEDYEVILDLMIYPAQPPREVIFPESDMTATISYDPEQPLSNINLINGSGAGTFSWRYPNTVPAVDRTEYPVVFTPAGVNNYDYSGVEGWDDRTRTITRTVSLTITPRDIAIDLVCDKVQTYTGRSLEICEAEVTVSELRSSPAESIALEYLFYRNGLLQDEVISAGVYEVIARSADVNYSGQSAPFAFIIEKAQPLIHLNDTTVIYTGEPVRIAYEITGTHTAPGLSRTLTFTYEDAEGTVYGPTETAPAEVGEYRVHVGTPGSVNHLPAEATAVLKIVSGVGIDRVASESFKVYPNPVSKNSKLIIDNGQLTIDNERTFMEVYDMNGSLLRKIPLTDTKTEIRSESREGVYLYVLRSDAGAETIKVVVK